MPPSEDPSALKNLPVDGAEWVELFVREMMSASNMDDARARASRALEVLEKSICSRVSAEVAQSFQQVSLLNFGKSFLLFLCSLDFLFLFLLSTILKFNSIEGRGSRILQPVLSLKL